MAPFKGDRLPQAVRSMNNGQVDHSGSGCKDDVHRQEARQPIPDLLMEGEQVQLEEEQPEVCIVLGLLC
jgi:hypothetical protein